MPASQGCTCACACVPTCAHTGKCVRVRAQAHMRRALWALWAAPGDPRPRPGKGPYLPGDAVFREPLAQGVEGPGVLLRLPGVLQAGAACGALGPPVSAHLQEAQQALCRAIQGQDLGRSTGRSLVTQAGLWLSRPGCCPRGCGAAPVPVLAAVTSEEMKSSSLPSSPEFRVKSTA